MAKKKRYAGPTKEALTKGLATKAEVEGPQPSAWDRFMAANTRDTSDLTPNLKAQIDKQLAAEPLSVSIINRIPEKPSLLEDTVKSMGIGYFMATKSLPDPYKVALMLEAGDKPRSAQEYADLWKPIGSLTEDSGARLGDFYSDSGYENLHGLADQLGWRRDAKTDFAGVADLLKPAKPEELAIRGTEQLPADVFRKRFDAILKAKEKRNPEVMDAVRKADQNAEILNVSNVVANRLRRRGAPVEWDTQKPWGDPDFYYAVAKFAFGRQPAYGLWGTNAEKREANKIASDISSIPYGSDLSAETAKKLGVEMPDWSSTTLGMVMDAMRSTDDEQVHEIAFDSWMFARPVGQSPSQARAEFANKFGLERLPVKELEKYEQGRYTFLGAVAGLTADADKVWEEAKKVPALGHGLAALGWAAGNVTKALSWPITESMRGLVTLYDVALTMDPATDGLTLAGYQKALSQGREFENEDRWKVWNYNLSRFFDASNWARAYEEAEGKTPVSELAKNWSLELSGDVKPWAKDIGDMIDFAVMAYEGIKIDPVYRGAAKATSDATFIAGRAAERFTFKTFAEARQTYAEWQSLPMPKRGKDTGTWVIRVGSEDLAKIRKTDPAKADRIEELQNKAELLDEELGELAMKGDRVEATAVTELDAPRHYKEVVESIIARGGISRDNEFWDAKLSLKENQTAFAGTARARNGQPIDTLAEELGFESGRELFDFLGNRPSVTRKRHTPSAVAMRELEKVERELDELKGDAEVEAVPKKDSGGIAGVLVAQERIRANYERLVSEGMSPEKAAKKARSLENRRNYDPEDVEMEREQARYDKEMDSEGVEAQKDTINAPDRMFATEEFIGEGKQAGLDIAIDTTAKKTEPVARPVERGPEQMPGQTAMEAKPTVNEQGVRVAEVRLKDGTTFMADADIAPPLQRINDAGYRTTQSHSGSKADHPAGSAARKAEPFVEFTVRELDAEPKLRTAKAAKIRRAAKRLQLEVKSGKNADGHSTIIVHGDVAKFADELLGEKPPAKPPTPVVPEEPPTPPTPPSPILNRWFRTNAEVVAMVDDPAYLDRLYTLDAENNPKMMDMAKRLAKETDPDKVEKLLRELETVHGKTIDGGASAVIRNMRQAAYRNSFGQRGPARLFVTSMSYTRRHSFENSSDMLFNVASASKLGKTTGIDDVVAARIRYYRRRMWEAKGNGKQDVVDEFWNEFEANLGEAGLKRMKKFESVLYRVKGYAYKGSEQTTVYRLDANKLETSRVGNVNKALGHMRHDVELAEAEFLRITEKSSKQFKDRVTRAFRDAEKDLVEFRKAIDENDVLSNKETLSEAEQVRLTKARETIDRVVDEKASDVPFKMGQARKHVTHRYNPKTVAFFMQGTGGQGMAILDAAVVQPVMTLFKETVMASIGFPIKVLAGDEAIRLIPEGTILRLKQGRDVRHELKAKGLWDDEIDSTIHEDSNAWADAESSQYQAYTPNEPGYFPRLRADLAAWRREPVVQRYVAAHGGEFPDSPADIKPFMKELRDEGSDISKDIKLFLIDTYRETPRNWDDWASQWEESLTAVAKEKTFRKAMTQEVTIDELKRVNEKSLWPVGGPGEAYSPFASRNPLYMLSGINPFHYLYQGIPIGKGVKFGAQPLLAAMSGKLREVLFSDAYYLERNRLLEHSPGMDKAELHQAAKSHALDEMNRMSYSSSRTVAEEMAKNWIPFISAYRQFWQYWLTTFSKHPASGSVALEELPAAEHSAFDLIGLKNDDNSQFFGMEDYQWFVPGLPFWAMRDEEAPEGMLGTFASNLPQTGFVFGQLMRTAIGAAGGDAERYADVPMLATLGKSMAPFSRHGRLYYGLVGDTPWGGNERAESLLGDAQKLEKAHINAVLSQLRYTDSPTGAEIQRDKPVWWRAAEDLLGTIGLDNVRPEALFNEASKAWNPTPASITFSPQHVREMSNALFDYHEAETRGDTKTMAQMRAKDKFLDVHLAYYDADEDEKIAMKRDPANVEHLKWWVSLYNYGPDSGVLDGRDWQTQFGEDKISLRSEEEVVASVHNLYTDIHGGTYVTSKYRAAGETYAGEANREQAEKRTKAKINKAMQFARSVAQQGAKTRGWDAAYLMEQFKNPDRNWGIWPDILKRNGLDPEQYNIKDIAAVFAAKYGDDYKLKPQHMSGNDALRALDLQKWIADPELSDDFLKKTPFAADITKKREEQRDDVMKALIDGAVAENWYFIGSQNLDLLGVKASPKLDLVMNDLHTEYLAWKKLKVGTSEYKAARNAYYDRRDSVLGNLKGGNLIAGGVADRLIANPYVLTPRVTTMGSGPGAVAQQRAFDNFVVVRDAELAKPDPNPEHINLAWDKLIGERKYGNKQMRELLRIGAWSYLLASAKHLRRELLDSYSDYYEAPRNSATAKFGKARVARLNTVVKSLREFSPEFSNQLDAWFGKKRNIGTLMLDWYRY